MIQDITATLKSTPAHAKALARITGSNSSNSSNSLIPDAHVENPDLTEAFPVDALPPVVADFCREVSRLLRVPESLPAACCLATISAAIGSRLRVKSFRGKVTPANIMLLAAAETGTGKSEAFRECVAPIFDCQTSAQSKWARDTFPTASASVKIIKKQIEGLEKKAQSPSSDRNVLLGQIKDLLQEQRGAESLLIKPCYIGSDFTTPALIKLLCAMQGQFFAASADAKNVVDQILGRYNDGASDEEVYLKGFSLEPIDRHRVAEGSESTADACISSLWLTQPDKLKRMLETRALSEGGLLPRLLMFHVTCPPTRVSADDEDFNDEVRQSYHHLVTRLFARFRSQDETAIIEADADVRDMLIDYHNTIADQRESQLRDVTGFAARWAEQAWRLSLILHAARHGGSAADYTLSAMDATDGIRIAKWFANQQLDLLNEGREGAKLEAYNKVRCLITEKGGEITAPDVYRKCITPRKEPVAAAALLEEMRQRGILSVEERPTARANHISRVYRLAHK